MQDTRAELFMYYIVNAIIVFPYSKLKIYKQHMRYFLLLAVNLRNYVTYLKLVCDKNEKIDFLHFLTLSSIVVAFSLKKLPGNSLLWFAVMMKTSDNIFESLSENVSLNVFATLRHILEIRRPCYALNKCFIHS